MVNRRRRSKKRGMQRTSVKYVDLLLGQGLKPEDVPDDLKGKAVHIPLVNFDVPEEIKARAKMGPPPYAVRAKMVEDLTEALMAELEDQWYELAETWEGDAARFAQIWLAVVETLELDELNKLIKEHNTFYPIEANLHPDPNTGGFTIGSTPWHPKKKITPERILKEFPAEIEVALESADESD